MRAWSWPWLTPFCKRFTLYNRPEGHALQVESRQDAMLGGILNPDGADVNQQDSEFRELATKAEAGRRAFGTAERIVDAAAPRKRANHPFGLSSNCCNRSPSDGGKRAGQVASRRPTPIRSRR